MAGTPEGGRKAAETRGHDSLAEAGRKGGERSHSGASSGSKGQGNEQKGNKRENENQDGGESGRSSSVSQGNR